MSMNIVDLVKNQLEGANLSKLSSFLGESSDRTQTAVGAAVPTLLSGMSSAASTPEGAQRLSAAIAEQEKSSDSFKDALSAQKTSYADKGASALSSLLGGGMSSNISSVLERFTGLKSGATTSLIGMLTPLIFNVLGRHQKSAGLTSAGLANFLTGQKRNIAAALPPGLGDMLSSIPGLGGLTQTTSGESIYPERPRYPEQPPPVAPEEINQYEQSAYEDPRVPARPARAGTGAGRWAVGLLAVLAAIGILWTVASKRGTEQITEPAGAAPSQPATVTKSFRDTLTSANTMLSGITDASSAEKALPKLNELNSKLSGMQPSGNSLPATAKPTMSSDVHVIVSKLESNITRLRTMPAAGEKLKPALDELESHLNKFTQSP